MSAAPRPLRVLITAGPTQEALDPVRFLSNRSTGSLGYAIARGALRRGHQVTLITGPTSRPPPACHVIRVMTARQMLSALRRVFPRCDWLFMTAAVADFRPRDVRRAKLKTAAAPSTLRLTLVRNPDLLATVTRRKGRRLVVGWALETERVLASAKAKLAAKRMDLVVGQRLTPGPGPFGVRPVRTILVDREGTVTRLPSLRKERLAAILLDKAKALWYRGANVNTASRCC